MIVTDQESVRKDRFPTISAMRNDSVYDVIGNLRKRATLDFGLASLRRSRFEQGFSLNDRRAIQRASRSQTD